MGNQLFHKAREAVMIAKQAADGISSIPKNEAIAVANNALSSAYANSTIAEQAQLHQLQDQLDQLK